MCQGCNGRLQLRDPHGIRISGAVLNPEKPVVVYSIVLIAVRSGTALAKRPKVVVIERKAYIDYDAESGAAISSQTNLVVCGQSLSGDD